MPLGDRGDELFQRLRKVGWTDSASFLVAPKRTMWLDKTNPWVGDLHDMAERMTGRLRRIRRNETMSPHFADPKRPADTDTAGLLRVLCELTNDSSLAAAAWELWRQDDGGDPFIIGAYPSEAAARTAMQAYEDRSHRMVYWVIHVSLT